MRRNILSMIVGIGVCLSGCVKDDIHPLSDRPVNSWTEYPTTIKGLSGLCLNSSGNGLYAVSDGGQLYELAFDGTVGRTLCDTKNDFEAVTIDTATGILYLVDEGENAIYRYASDTLEQIALIDVPGGGVSNKGLEGVMFDGHYLYVANQAEPTLILKYDPAAKAVVGQIGIDFVTFLSDIAYDAVDNALWILDSKGPKLYKCTIAGEVVKTWSVDFVAKAEALALDRNHGCVWLGCDQTSRLYRVEIDF